MTRPFVLDENVIILAQKQENDRGDSDLDCLVLLNRIIEICHPIVLDSTLWGRYQSQLNKLPMADIVLPHLLATLTRPSLPAGKLALQDNAPAFPEETAIQQHGQGDVEIVRLAVATSAILVTTDQPLLSDLETAGIRERYNLQVVSPAAALPLL